MPTFLYNILLVGLGSCVGGIVRYLVSKLINDNTASAFPWGTLAVNLLGCFIIGFIYGLIDRGFSLSAGMKLFLTVGFCGGFTTFSTFMHENYLLFGGGNPILFISYMAVSVIFGLLLVYSGFYLSSIAR